MKASNGCVVDTKIIDGRTLVTITGHITESSNLPESLSWIKDLEFHVDVSGVTRINSMGVSNWIDFVQRVERSQKKLVLERCSPMMVGLLNMVSGTAGQQGKVKSVMAPYECRECGTSYSKVFELPNKVVESMEITTRCERCKGPLIFADTVDAYLNFHNDKFL